MISSAVLEPVTSAAQARPAGVVLVALKPFDGVDSAISMARWLATVRHAELQAIGVIEIGTMDGAVLRLPTVPAQYYQRERTEVAADLRARVASSGNDVPPRIDVLEGASGSAVASAAMERGASVIVIGTGHYGMLGRFLYGERAIDVVRRAATAVLVVPPYVEPPLTRAVVAVDFSHASMRAAIGALEMLDPRGRLTLVHVERASRRLDAQVHRSFEESERRQRDLFARFLAALPESPGIQIETITLRGDAVGALLRYAEEQEAELIACGRRGSSASDRRPLGSVSIALVRGAPCCVLVAPELPGDEGLD